MPIVTGRFQELVTAIAFKKGIPNMRIVYTPHPLTDRPAALCRKYLEGKDSITGVPILQEIAAGLTKPVSDKDKQTGFLPRPPRTRLLVPDTSENLEKYFYDNDLTDGLPIVLPTEKKVGEMLKATSHKPDEIVGKMAPSTPHEAWEYTVEMVAANAVMSGARPEYFPAILALASTGATSLVSSTSSYARMAVFNGPFVQEIGMNAGVGAMGPFNRANSTIGRCWTLISKNLGGSGKSGETYMGTQGSALNFSNLCFPEAEDG
ncbi:MAG TPA: UGSC family (seleno)protein, partial [Acidobacteriota bacterium]|nr:UGSC family (seleno)protein [Acidobacteriota bacterium]